MVAFVKHQMLKELQSVFLYMAETLRIGASPKMANTFMGFSVANGGSYNRVRTSAVDLSRFDITPHLDYAYDFAFKAKCRKGEDFAFLDRVHAFVDLLPKSSMGEEMAWTHQYALRNGYCQSVATAMQARWNLEFEPEGHLFSLTEIALLADTSEDAVLKAVADNGLRANQGFECVVIDHASAKRWLAEQPSFRSALPGTGSRS